MKPVAAYAGSIESNIESESIDFDLDLSAEGRAHILSLLTDLYTDKELACIREYATNARDANIMAGRADVPIEIELPNQLSPNYVIKDSGVGLSVKDLETVFSKYGASDKRTSDLVNGMLGLGGKAALTYTSQFTITSVKAGMKANVIVSRREDGTGTMDVVSNESTNEPNGTTVTIPVQTSNGFATKAQSFFYYWMPGTVLVNGKQPQHLIERQDVAKLGDNVFIIKDSRSYNESDLIVMGNVAYKIGNRNLSEIVASRNYYSQVIVFVEMGTVTFAPSREGLSDTPRTQKAIKAIGEQIKADLKGQVESDLAAISSHADAFAVWVRWANIVGTDKMPSVKYKGESFSSIVREPHWEIEIEGGRYNYKTGTSANARRERSQAHLEALLSDQVVVVTGYTSSGGPTPTQMKKVELYREQQNITPAQFLLFNDLPGKPWTNDVKTVAWDTINAIKIPKTATGPGISGYSIPVLRYASGGSHSFRSGYGSKGTWDEVKSNDLDPNEGIFLISPAEMVSNMNDIHRLMATFPKSQIIGIGKNRWEKFQREFSSSVDFRTYMRSQFAVDLAASMSDDEKFVAQFDTDYRTAAAELGDKINDKEWNRLWSLKTLDTKRVKVYNESSTPTRCLSTDYPLASTWFRQLDKGIKAHNITYINAVIAEGI